MNQTPLSSYGSLCALFYDATKKFASEKEVLFYASFIQGRTLEAMCGSGRLLIPLREHGYIVDGVDNSTAMIKHCHERLKQAHLTAQIYEQSLEKMNLLHKYQTVTIAVGSFQLLTSPETALITLKKIYDHMESNGNLLIDFFIPNFEETRSERQVRIDASSRIRPTTRYFFNNTPKIADAYCFYELIVNGTLIKTEQELIQVTWY